MTVNEEAMITHDGKWYTVVAPAQGPTGFTTGWLADESGKIIYQFRGKFTTTDELVETACTYLNK